LQERFDLAVKRRYLCRANVLRVDAAIAADHESNRQAENTSIKFPNPRVAHGNRIIHVETLIEVMDALAFTYRSEVSL
jgi:hypothetical protein